MIVMITFGFIYTQFVNIFYGIYNNLLMGMTGSLEPVVPEYKNLGLNVFGAFLYLIIAIQLTLLYFQFLTRGFEMLILRLGIPFASIGLLNSDNGVFTEYIRDFLLTAFTLVVQLALLNLSILSLVNGHLIYGIAIAIVSVNTPMMLGKFMIKPSGSLINSVGNTARSIRAILPRFGRR